MEATTFELRPTGPVYPLPFDQRLAQGDNYRKDKEILEKTLQSIHNFYKTPYASAHTGEHLDCERCIGLKRQVKQAYREWYLSEEPDRWYSRLFDYRTELQAMFEKPDEYDLAAIHQRADTELRSHLKRDICAHAPGDTDEVTGYKLIAARELDEGKPIPEVLGAYLENQFKSCPSSDLADFIRELNATTSDEERIPIYIRFYCADLWADSSNIKNFKAKYSRMFEQGIPHDTVVAAMRKEISASREVEISDLQRRLNELNLAQSAHLKAKAKKAEKDQMKDQRNMSLVEIGKAVCAYDECSKNIDSGVGDEVVQCVECYTSNLGAHRQEYHPMDDGQGQEFLEFFRVPEDLHVVTENGFEDVEMKEG
ncbi:hypothetical protein CJF32_00006456 [Rutstroemia sp. NJR-2017a WRK4]|nr:hypothetical protein CJF32_00006456 [Rutstroemia sp. NJR-2017a WRK4]